MAPDLVIPVSHPPRMLPSEASSSRAFSIPPLASTYWRARTVPRRPERLPMQPSCTRLPRLPATSSVRVAWSTRVMLADSPSSPRYRDWNFTGLT